jgi:hypothetical protein
MFENLKKKQTKKSKKKYLMKYEKLMIISICQTQKLVQ